MDCLKTESTIHYHSYEPNIFTNRRKCIWGIHVMRENSCKIEQVMHDIILTVLIIQGIHTIGPFEIPVYILSSRFTRKQRDNTYKKLRREKGFLVFSEIARLSNATMEAWRHDIFVGHRSEGLDRFFGFNGRNRLREQSADARWIYDAVTLQAFMKISLIMVAEKVFFL